jgi:hypothetical protein
MRDPLLLPPAFHPPASLRQLLSSTATRCSELTFHSVVQSFVEQTSTNLTMTDRNTTVWKVGYTNDLNLDETVCLLYGYDGEGVLSSGIIAFQRFTPVNGVLEPDSLWFRDCEWSFIGESLWMAVTSANDCYKAVHRFGERTLFVRRSVETAAFVSVGYRCNAVEVCRDLDEASAARVFFDIMGLAALFDFAGDVDEKKRLAAFDVFHSLSLLRAIECDTSKWSEVAQNLRADSELLGQKVRCAMLCELPTLRSRAERMSVAFDIPAHYVDVVTSDIELSTDMLEELVEDDCLFAAPFTELFASK